MIYLYALSHDTFIYIYLTCFDCIYFVGVNIHMLVIRKYLLTCIYIYVYCLQKPLKKIPSILFCHKKLMFEVN